MRPALTYEEIRQVVLEQQEEVKLIRERVWVERDKMPEILSVIEKSWIKVIMGIRRCGKSMLGHLALKNKNYGYLNFDDERLIGLSSSDLNKMLQFLLELNPGVEVLFFDEIQNVEGWELFISRLYRQGYNIVITGSNSKLLSKELASHLTGRYVLIELYPFSFHEFLKARSFHLKNRQGILTTQEQAMLYSHLTQYLHMGGFPDIVLEGYSGNYLRELYDKIISKDITTRYALKYSQTLKEIAVYCFANLSTRLTFHKLKNIFEISSIHTVKNYFRYLTDAYLIFQLSSFSFKYKEQIKQPRKTYTIDNGLSAAISPKFTEDRGAALENVVFQELQRRGSSFGYYSTPDCEVDFVVHKDKEVIALIQVSASIQDLTTQKREYKALIKAASHLKCKNLLILTWEEEKEDKIEGLTIKIVPIWKWLLTEVLANSRTH